MKQITTGLLSFVFLTVFSSSLAATELQGEVRRDEPLVLSTNLAAEVLKAPARIGQRVKKGELLVQLEDSVLRARLSQMRAGLSHQKLMLSEAKNELQRSEELYDRTLLSDHDLDLARIAHAGAESSYRRAITELKAVQRELVLTRIVAPFGALVVARHCQAGETLNGQFKSVPLYTIVNEESRLFRLTVDEALAASVTIGDEVALQINTQRYSGRVVSILSETDSATHGSVIVDIQFMPGKDETVAIGETGQAHLP